MKSRLITLPLSSVLETSRYLCFLLLLERSFLSIELHLGTLVIHCHFQQLAHQLLLTPDWKLVDKLHLSTWSWHTFLLQSCWKLILPVLDQLSLWGWFFGWPNHLVCCEGYGEDWLLDFWLHLLSFFLIDY